MQDIDVSVIIPVYNCEKYLKDCLDSILNQTLTTIEVICVDDCSIDHSVLELERYKQIDSRVRVLKNKSNLGAAASRNRGAKYANGEYIIFLDADDWFEPTMLDEMFQAAEQNEADVVLCGMSQFGDGQLESKNIFPGIYIAKQLIDTFPVIQSPKECCFLFQANYPITAWNKLCRRSFVESNNLSFQNLKISNDVYFSCVLLIYAKKLYFVDKKLVHYRTGTNTSTTVRHKENADAVLCAFDKLYDELYTVGMPEALYQSFLNKVFEQIAVFYNRSSIETQRRVCGNMQKKYMPKWLSNHAYEKWFYTSNTKKMCDYFMFPPSYENEHFSMFIDESAMQNFYTRIKQSNVNQIAIWGIGQYGKQFLSLLTKSNQKVDKLYDQNKAGEIVSNMEICDYHQDTNPADAIIITYSKWMYDILSEVKAGTKIFDAYMYFFYGKFHYEEKYYP